MNITTAQIKAARALLGWSTYDLAEFSDLSISTINNIENGRHTTHKKTLEKMIQVFEKFGICFVEKSGVLLNSSIKVYEGIEGVKKYLDYSYEVLKNTSSEHRIYTINDLVLRQTLGPMIEHHYKRLMELKEVKMKMFTPDGYFLGIDKFDNALIKKIPRSASSTVANSFFAGHIALFIMKKLRVIVIQDQDLYELGVKNFDFIWDSV